MRALDARDPRAHRLVHRVLEGRAPRLHRDDLGAEQLHAPHVQRLPFDIDRAHVDGATQTEERRRGRGGDTVLAGAGLRDYAVLAHAPREQRLPEHVVDLVRTGVREVFALQQHADAEPVREPVTFGDRGGAARRSSTATRRTRCGTSSSDHAARNSASSWTSAGTSVSGANRPPYSPNRPSPTGSGPAVRGAPAHRASGLRRRSRHPADCTVPTPNRRPGLDVDLPVPGAGDAGDLVGGEIDRPLRVQLPAPCPTPDRRHPRPRLPRRFYESPELARVLAARATAPRRSTRRRPTAAPAGSRPRRSPA